jgi:hypothetical protein
LEIQLSEAHLCDLFEMHAQLFEFWLQSEQVKVCVHFFKQGSEEYIKLFDNALFLLHEQLPNLCFVLFNALFV